MLEFIVVVLLLFIIPGPAVIITITKSLQGGVKAGITTGAGIALGDLVHTIAAILGLSAILMTSTIAFEIVKYLGVAYLMYLGIQAILQKKQTNKSTVEKNEQSNTVSFRQGFMIEVLNPKTALFFLAFLPQFVKSDGLPVVYQLLILGLTFVTLSILYTSLLAILSSLIGQKILQHANVNWKNKLIGSIYIALGVRLLFQSQN